MIKIFLSDLDGTLTDGSFIVSSDGTLTKKFQTRDFAAFSTIRKGGLMPVVITSGNDGANKAQAQRHEGKWILCEAVVNKLEFVIQNVVTKHGDQIPLSITCDLEDMAFIGDDVNDMELLRSVGYCACPADAINEVKTLVTQHGNGYVCEKKGGEGCVREFIDYLAGKGLLNKVHVQGSIINEKD